MTLGLADVLSQADSRRTLDDRRISSAGALLDDGNHVRADRSIGQKLDHLITLCVDNKNAIAEVQRDNVATRRNLSSLATDEDRVFEK